MLTFHKEEKSFLIPALQRLLWNPLRQPHFGYICSVYHPGLSTKLRKKLKSAQNKCIRLYLIVNKIVQKSQKKLKTLN